MISTPSLKSCLDQKKLDQAVTVMGWVRHKRVGKKVAFLALHDGSMQQSLQVVLDGQKFAAQLHTIGVGASVEVKGHLRCSPGKGQGQEVEANHLLLLGNASLDYPLQPKAHSRTFLQNLQHLRLRTNTFRAVFRIRHLVPMESSAFFMKKVFIGSIHR